MYIKNIKETDHILRTCFKCFKCVSISLVIWYDLVGGSERTGGDRLIFHNT